MGGMGGNPYAGLGALPPTPQPGAEYYSYYDVAGRCDNILISISLLEMTPHYYQVTFLKTIMYIYMYISKSTMVSIQTYELYIYVYC